MADHPANPISPPSDPAAESAVPAPDLSVSRPMSDEERAALEEVYQERGCGGGACDC